MIKRFLNFATVAIVAFAFSACSDDEPNKPDEPDGPTATVFETPANTYIVSEAGDYEFYTKKVSGVEIDGVAKVDWIWATRQAETDTEQTLVSDIAYENGKVSFTASGAEGNVVFAAFNSEGKIIWEWLIWCTDQPEDIEFASGAVFGDRFIGATSCNPEDGTKTWGCISYQWGRIAPIFTGYEDEYTADGTLFAQARKWTIMNPEYGLEWKVEKKLATVEEAIAAPTTFFMGNGGGTWITAEDRTLWGTVKTDYDPSPAGYRLSSSEDWGEDFIKSLNIAADESGATYTHNGKSTYFPSSVKNRDAMSGEAIVGFSGFMSYNCDYKLHDPMGYSTLVGTPNFKYTLDDLVAMGLVSYYPTRVAIMFKLGTVSETNSVSNPAFSIPVRYVKIK